MADVRETEIFSADFVDALSHLLASILATALVSDAQLQQMEYQLFQIDFDKERSLREKIDKATTQEEVDAISWDL